MFRKFITLACIAALVLSCGKDGGNASSRPINLRVSAADATRSLPVTTQNISIFEVMATADSKYHDLEGEYPAGLYFTDVVRKSGGTWVMDDQHLWLNKVNIHLWCYSPLDLDTAASGVLSVSTPSTGSDKLQFTYAMPSAVAGSDATNQKDIVFAGNSESRSLDGDKISGHTSSNPAYKREDNEVDVVFYHPLSEIRFAVSPTDGSFDTERLGIGEVTIGNISGSGKCSFTLPSTFAWSDLGAADKQYSQAYNATFASKPDGWTAGTFGDSQTIYVCDNAFFVIPQTLTGRVLTVTFKRLADGSTITKEANLSGSWLPGKYYTYKLEAYGLGDDIEFNASVLDWEEVIHVID